MVIVVQMNSLAAAQSNSRVLVFKSRSFSIFLVGYSLLNVLIFQRVDLTFSIGFGTTVLDLRVLLHTECLCYTIPVAHVREDG